MPNRNVDLVLIPGLLCSPALWAEQIRQLSDTANISVGEHTRHADLREIAAAILTAAPPRFALAGLSMGGYVAFEILRQAADRVTRLALLDTSARPDPPERREDRLRLIALAEATGAGRAQQELLPALVHPARLSEQALSEAVLQMARDTGVAAFKRQQAAIMARPDNRPLLASIRCPTLVLVGREDALTPPPLAQEIAEGIAGAKLEIIADCGHLSSMEQPEAVNRALRAWLGA
jgi:pimeloyl-ACP methyl ester carboxylesterase